MEELLPFYNMDDCSFIFRYKANCQLDICHPRNDLGYDEDQLDVMAEVLEAFQAFISDNFFCYECYNSIYASYQLEDDYSYGYSGLDIHKDSYFINFALVYDDELEMSEEDQVNYFYKGDYFMCKEKMDKSQDFLEEIYCYQYNSHDLLGPYFENLDFLDFEIDFTVSSFEFYSLIESNEDLPG